MTMQMYKVFLDEIEIGTTQLEHEDISMGVAFGNIDSVTINYSMLRNYCLENGCELVFDSPEEKLISTSVLPGLVVLSDTGEKLDGDAQIVGMDSEAYSITVFRTA